MVVRHFVLELRHVEDDEILGVFATPDDANTAAEKHRARFKRDKINKQLSVVEWISDGAESVPTPT